MEETVIVEEVIVEEVVIKDFAEREEHIPHAKVYWVHVNGEVIKVETPTLTGEALLKAAGKGACAFELIAEFSHNENEVIEPNETVNLRKHGLKGFITAHKEIVTISISGKPYSIERGDRTVADILARVSLAPAAYDLYDEKSGLPVSSNQPVKIHGCEEFITQVRGGAAS